MIRVHQISGTNYNDAVIESDQNSTVFAVGLCITVTIIILFGLTMLYSTSYDTAGSSFFIKQLVWGSLGYCGATAIVLVGYKKLSSYSLIFIGISAILLIIADFCFPAVKGAHRWIKIPHVGNIQPSEFAKLSVILFLSKYCSDHIRSLNYFPFKHLMFLLIPVAIVGTSGVATFMLTGNLWLAVIVFSAVISIIITLDSKIRFFYPHLKESIKKGLLAPVIITSFIMLLIFTGKDLGTTLLLGAVSLGIFFVSGVRLRFFVLPVLTFICGMPLLKYVDPERWSRMTSFLNPELCQKADGYQLWASLLALGSGGPLGQGFTQSKMKQLYLPEAHTDFILSIVGEELGFVFICLVIGSYLAFMFFAFMICIKSRKKHGMILGFGLTILVVMQAIINLGVVSGSLPTKGMPAPFISYGGSNMIMSLLAVGILVSIAIDSVNPDFNKELLVSFKKSLRKLFFREE